MENEGCGHAQHNPNEVSKRVKTFDAAAQSRAITNPPFGRLRPGDFFSVSGARRPESIGSRCDWCRVTAFHE